jgi:Flp pilus assembly pilin Flp
MQISVNGKKKQLGQGMTEYIIIVALIAIAAIVVFGAFGKTIRGQMTAVTGGLAGDTAAKTQGAKGAADGAKAATTDNKQTKDMKNFQ